MIRGALVALLLLGAALAQEVPPEVPQDDPDALEAESLDSDAAAADGAGGPDAQEAPVDGPDDDETIRATLERFVPSEQISEDNSVAYPNDI